jgi:hypothetical protein
MQFIQKIHACLTLACFLKYIYYYVSTTVLPHHLNGDAYNSLNLRLYSANIAVGANIGNC